MSQAPQIPSVQHQGFLSIGRKVDESVYIIPTRTGATPIEIRILHTTQNSAGQTRIGIRADRREYLVIRPELLEAGGADYQGLLRQLEQRKPVTDEMLAALEQLKYLKR